MHFLFVCFFEMHFLFICLFHFLFHFHILIWFTFPFISLIIHIPIYVHHLISLGLCKRELILPCSKPSNTFLIKMIISENSWDKLIKHISDILIIMISRNLILIKHFPWKITYGSSNKLLLFSLACNIKKTFIGMFYPCFSPLLFKK